MTSRINTFSRSALALSMMFAAATAAVAQGSEAAGMTGSGSTASTAKSGMGKSGAAADQSFAMQAAKGGMAEVALGQMAKEKAASDAVKQFGAHMVDDHTKANDELKQIATGKNIMLPDAAPEDATSRKLKSLSGPAFDKAYMSAMLTDHKKTIALFEKEARGGKDADLKAFATKTLPTLKSHLEMVQQTKTSVASN